MTHPDERDVIAPCDCTIVVDHTKGDRLAICDHGHRWNVSAYQPAVEYRFTRATGW